MRTTVEFEGPIIDRPLDEVFAFVSDLENSPDWGRTSKSVKDPDGPDAVGAVFREEARIMGQKVKHQSEVTGLDPPTGFSYANHFENGVIERTRVTFVAVEGGTRIDLASEVEIERFPQVIAPIVSMVIRQRMDTLLKKLEGAFEVPDKTVGGAATMIAVGAILLATAGLRYLIEVFPEGEWWTVLALFAGSLICAGTAGIVWRAARRGAEREDSEAEGAEPGPAVVDRRPIKPEAAPVAPERQPEPDPVEEPVE